MEVNITHAFFKILNLSADAFIRSKQNTENSSYLQLIRLLPLCTPKGLNILWENARTLLENREGVLLTGFPTLISALGLRHRIESAYSQPCPEDTTAGIPQKNMRSALLHNLLSYPDLLSEYLRYITDKRLSD